MKTCREHRVKWDPDVQSGCWRCIEDEDIETDGLIARMRKTAADTSRYATKEQRADLITLAFALELAIESKDPQRILAAWSRARRYWCAVTGVPLL